MNSPHPEDDRGPSESPDSEALPPHDAAAFTDFPPNPAQGFDSLLAESSRQIGPYKLLQELGVGGMGSVWLAEQQRPVRRRVALKLIKAGRTDRQIMARFEAERQALSMMDHPNIARVLDAGTAEGGTPYFVMELVQGDPITKYCDRHRLTPRERLHLFLPICDAIQHAHQKGIIHRDLKPSNVMVQVDNERPVAKVIDFGLAKALQHQTKLTDKTIFTEFGQIVGTVQYMSPEQARTDAIDVDTRTDIYSLGVMLYELMAGSTPLDEATLQSNAVLQLLEIIREKEPPRPSQRLSSSRAQLVLISEQRQVQPAKLQQLLRGDVDWIIMKSLEKDRTRRYATAKDFADDIRAYLNGDTVAARPPTTTYRIRKFARKNRALVITVSLFIALLTAGIVGTTLFAIKANRLRNEANAMRNAAEIAAKRSADILAVVTDSFEAVDPSSGSDATMTAKDVLLHAQESLANSELDAEGRRSLLAKLTTCFISLGEYDKALDAASQWQALSHQSLGEQHPETLKAMQLVGIAYRFLGQYDKATPIFEKVLRLRKSVLGDEHFETLTSLGNLADAYIDTRRIDEGLPLAEETYQRRKALLGETHPQTLSAMNNLATAYESVERFEEATSLLEETRDRMKKVLGEDHPETLTAMSNLAGIYEVIGRLDDSISLYEKTLQATKRKMGSEHPDTITSMNNLAYVYDSAGRFAESIPLFEATLESVQAVLGKVHPMTISTMNNLAAAYEAVERWDESIPLYEQCVEMLRDTAGDEDPMTLMVIANLSRALRNSGRPTDAVPLDEEVLRTRRQLLGKNHPGTFSAMNGLASSYMAAERFAEAAPLLKTCLDAERKKRPHSWQKFQTESQYGEALLGLGQLDEAATLLVDGYEGLNRSADSIPLRDRSKRLKAALQRLIQLAEIQQDPDSAAKWEAALAELEEGAHPTTPSP